MSDDLDLASRLFDLNLASGFVASPGGGAEFVRPPAWQATPMRGADEVLADWRPGWAVCAVTGDQLAVVDVDPRHGGDAEAVRQSLDGLHVRVFAEVSTPGGGRHFYVAGHPDLPTSHNLTGWPGVDVQSHGAHVFLPGTRRPKYDGGGYTVIWDDLGALADGGDPDGAESLVGFVAAHRPHGGVEAHEVAPQWSGGRPEQREAAYLATALDRTSRELAAKAPDSGRNIAAYTAALKCGSYVAGAGLDENVGREALMAACVANGLVAEDGDRQVAATIESGLRNGKSNPKAVPLARDQVTVLEDDPAGSVDASTGEVLAEDPGPGRRLVLTPASAIKPQRVKWLWDKRLALGTLGLLAGREGLGKSTLGYWLAAQVTRGQLPGESAGEPRAVLVCAAEDSWEHTIVPRLIAAGADLDRVYRVEIVTSDDFQLPLSLPRDLHELEANAREVGAALLLLDPLMSRLSEALDTHRDSDVRRALEPLVALAGRVGMAVMGLIHHNKGGSTDPLTLVMGSKAFTSVARSVHTVIPDPDDETGQRRLFGTPKNNLGPNDRPTLAFTIEGFQVPTEGDEPAWTGRIAWGGELTEGIEQTMRRAGGTEEERTAATEAAEWLHDYVLSKGGSVPSGEAKAAGRRAGHSDSALGRARRKLNLWIKSEGFPRSTYWGDPEVCDRDPAPQEEAVTSAVVSAL